MIANITTSANAYITADYNEKSSQLFREHNRLKAKIARRISVK